MLKNFHQESYLSHSQNILRGLFISVQGSEQGEVIAYLGINSEHMPDKML